jgi:hypothetical protein
MLPPQLGRVGVAVLDGEAQGNHGPVGVAPETFGQVFAILADGSLSEIRLPLLSRPSRFGVGCPAVLAVAAARHS